MLWIEERSGSANGELFVYQQAAKLTEEVGELHAELLGRSKMQRTDKEKSYCSDSLAAEMADVAICLAILAEATHIDLQKAIISKMKTVESRIDHSNHA